MTVRVRPVRPEEYDQAGAITALAYAELFSFGPGQAGWQRYLAEIADVAGRAGRTLVLAAVEDATVLGTATLELGARVGEEEAPLPADEAHLRMLGVHPDHRRRGIGRLLLEACIEEARRAGKTRFTLNTHPRMRAARRMYESQGFRRGKDRSVADGLRLLSYWLPIGEGEGGGAPPGAGSLS